MKDKVSVIVPVYNVEKYLGRCVESIVRQTYENLEIILVDDGSPDKCPGLCDEWAKKDKRIKVIHKENGGLSSARNAGIDIMSGDFVYFVDSDDSIKPNTIEVLLKLLIENNCDMSFSRYDRIYDDSVSKKIYQPPFTGKVKIFDEDSFWKYYYEITNVDELAEILVNMIISCNKLIKSAVFDGLRFEEGKVNEDEIIITSLVSRCKKIVFIDSFCYEYYYNSGSIMADINDKQKFDLINTFEKRCVDFAKRKKDYTYNAFVQYFGKFRWGYFDLKADSYYGKALISSYREAYKACAPYLKAAKFKDRIIYKSFYINVDLYRFINKITRIDN